MRTFLSSIHSIPVRSVALIAALLLSGCLSKPDDNSINPNIVEVVNCCGAGGLYADIIPGIWTDGDSILFPGAWPDLETDLDPAYGFASVKLDENLNGSSMRTKLLLAPRPVFRRMIYATSADSTILFVVSTDLFVSVGSLWEHRASSGETVELIGLEHNVSSAVYWHGDDSMLVYYSYGNGAGKLPGYYLYDKSAGAHRLLVSHLSPLGPDEVINGFDLSPDNRHLLIPDVRTDLFSGILPSRIVEYDLQSETADTFDVHFDVSNVRVGLWLRYSPDGRQILYCNFPLNALRETTNDDSEVGIIDRESRQKTVLNVNTSANTGRSVQFAPTWSPDGRHILFASSRYFPREGSKSMYSTYILKNASDPNNHN